MRSPERLAAALLTAVCLVAACDRPASETPGADSAAAPPADQAVAPSAGSPAARAPDVFRVRFETSRGSFVVEARRAWSPNGVDRFHQLVSSGFYDNNRFFRVVPGFIVQFGMHGDPEVNRSWDALTIPDDPVVQQNRRGTVTFAKPDAPNARTTHLFINYADNLSLDAMGFSPIGTVVEGMSVVDNIFPGYEQRPQQPLIAAEGNEYLQREFPDLDFIRTARIVPLATADSTARRDSTRP
ncbi:MAG TPA: peptidylprolyl isomerase [Gemmatimonadaceae bacterium]|nr:peptidylprolyl isomerase [Gemmatimonadaceae bacterium]